MTKEKALVRQALCNLYSAEADTVLCGQNGLKLSFCYYKQWGAKRKMVRGMSRYILYDSVKVAR